MNHPGRVKLIAAVIVGAVGLYLLFDYLRMTAYMEHNRLFSTRAELHQARAAVKSYKEKTGQSPESLVGLRYYAKASGVDHSGTHPYTEYLSDPDGASDEHAALTGEGGFYYDPIDGIVRINLTKTVKHYLRFAYGSGGEVPADW